MKLLRSWTILQLLAWTINAYDLIQDYSGSTFFDGWNFYGSWDNLTLGDTWWVDENDAFMQGLAYINGAGNAVIKVDNSTNVSLNFKRNAVRITTLEAFNFGSLWIIDILHMPYGCSVWPAFWSYGVNWPFGGEIDILEGINRNQHNQMALHTIEGCINNSPSTPETSSGQQTQTNCSLGSGCTIQDTRIQSYGDNFSNNGGGVWATQFDVAGIFMWFWPRNDIPKNINSGNATSIDLSTWGPPTGSFPNSSSCPMLEFFTPQQLVLDITLCGDWAGVPAIYNSTCKNAGPKANCYLDNVVGDPTKFDDAYFEVAYLKAYTTIAPGATPTPAAPLPASTTTQAPPQHASQQQPSASDATRLFAISIFTICLPLAATSWIL